MAEFGALGDAIVEFDRAIERSPDDARFHFHKGDTLALAGLHDEALVTMARSIELDPQNADYHYFRGLVHNAVGDYFGALKEFEPWLEAISPSSPSQRFCKLASIEILCL